MTCIKIDSGFVCVAGKPTEIKLKDGSSLWVEYHPCCGAIVWKDEDLGIEYDNWWEDEEISSLVDSHYKVMKYGVGDSL